MKLALDHRYSPLIAKALRGRDLDVVAAIEANWEADADETILTLCAG